MQDGSFENYIPIMSVDIPLGSVKKAKNVYQY